MNYDQLKTAIIRFGEMLRAWQDQTARRSSLEQEAIQDSLVRRFEYTLEMSWKSCKRHLTEEGFSEAKIGSPKSIMRLAFESGVITNVENWINYINARQDTSHDYSGEKADRVLEIVNDFLTMRLLFIKKMSGDSLD